MVGIASGGIKRNATEEGALQFLQEKHEGITDKENPVFYYDQLGRPEWIIKLELEYLDLLRELGLVTLADYIRPQTGKVDPSVRSVQITPAGLEKIGRIKITEHVERVTEILPLVDENPLPAPERLRQLVRTERGNAIIHATAEAVVSDVRSHIQAIRNPNLRAQDRSKYITHQVWLRYYILQRWKDIPADLRHEAEDCRDMPFQPRRRGMKS